MFVFIRIRAVLIVFCYSTRITSLNFIDTIVSVRKDIHILIFIKILIFIWYIGILISENFIILIIKCFYIIFGSVFPRFAYLVNIYELPKELLTLRWRMNICISFDLLKILFIMLKFCKYLEISFGSFS